MARIFIRVTFILIFKATNFDFTYSVINQSRFDKKPLNLYHFMHLHFKPIIFSAVPFVFILFEF